MAGAAIVWCAPAAAQDRQEAEAPETVIVVSSTKDPATSLLEYPGSVTVIDSEELDARQFRDLSTLSYSAPNVSLDPIGTFKGVANFSIRGLGINSSIPSIDPTVGLFVDGVYMGVNTGTVFDALDVERVDILRGPQGVSFGRNTTGGAVMVETADPSESWEGIAGLSLEGPVDNGRGSHMVSLRGVVSGPISDSLSFRLGALRSRDEGYFRNLFDGKDFGAAETTVLRGGLAHRGDRLILIAKGEWTDSAGDGAAGHNNGLFPRDSFDLSVNQPGFYKSESAFATLRAEYELGNGVLTDIFGWRDYNLATRNDIDSSPEKIFESDTATAQEQWSNELTYAVDLGSLRLIGGSYIFHQKVGYEETRDLSAFGQPTYYGGGTQDHDVYGMFGQVDWQVTDAVGLKAGLRWSREEKAARITYVGPRNPCSAIAGACPVAGERVTGESNGFTDTERWQAFSPRLVATYDVSESANLYASWARGHRSGGYNLRITQPQAFEQVAEELGSPAFGPEQVDTFELGAKWKSADGLMFVQTAAFWTEVQDLQRELNVPSKSSGLAQSVYNTADARILGGEVEASLRPAEGLNLSAHLGVADAEYREIFLDLTGDGEIDRDDLSLELPRAPKWTLGGSASYEVALSAVQVLRANMFFQHRARYAYTDNNWGFNSASDRLDASLAYAFNDLGISLTVYGRNLLDEVQFGGDTQLAFAGGPLSDGDNEPFDPRPGAGTFSPIFKGRVLAVELAGRF